MSAQIQRALLLFEQARYEMAEAELRQALAMDPHQAFAHSLLGLCLAQRQQFKEATQEAQQAIHLEPDLPYAHFALARIFYDRNRYDEALATIQEALRLDPTDADYYALLAGVHLAERRWPAALEAAERGLAADAEHVGCTNLRAIALVKLGRKAEAGATIDAALSKAPENSMTHANQGWTLLERGEPKKALEHFREALRLDPENEWARQGIIEALKARHFLYALMLRYFLFMSRLGSRAQWGIILGGYFGNRLLGSIAGANPRLAPWILPLRILYISFVLLTWTADPLFNLLLRLNRFGRMALSADQRLAANCVGACLALALTALIGCFFTGFSTPYLLAALVFGMLLMPVAGTFKCDTGWPRTMMAIYTGVMALAGVAAVILLLLPQPQIGDKPAEPSTPAVALLTIFLIGAIGSGWVANILISQRVRR